MTRISVELTPAPTTPLNLRFDVLYAPRIPTPPYVGFKVEQRGTGFGIIGIDVAGVGLELYRSDDVAAVYQRFAAHLRMDVPDVSSLTGRVRRDGGR